MAASAEASHELPTERRPRQTRILTWREDEGILAARAQMSGRAVLEMVRRGDVPPPPVAALLEIAITDVGEGRVTLRARPDSQHDNGLGVVAGGYAATLLDGAMGCAAESLQPPGRFMATVQLNVCLVRPITQDTGPVEATAAVVHAGARTATAEAQLYAVGTDTLLAHATSVLLARGPGR